MRKKWKRLLQQELNKEADQLMELVNTDPKVRDAVAPQEMHDKLFARIHAEEEKKARLSEEEKELIRLGKVYKKRRKLNKYLVLIAAVVAAMAVGVTSIGGPEKIIQRVAGMMEGNEQINVDMNEGKTDEIKSISEVEAYEQIEEEFGFYPVRLDYLPDGMIFDDMTLEDSVQCVYMSYVGQNGEKIIYTIYPNYRTGSFGNDIEDNLVQEFDKEMGDITIHIKEYAVDENQTKRCVAEYEYNDVYYFLRLIALEETECEKIVENLFFP